MTASTKPPNGTNSTQEGSMPTALKLLLGAAVTFALLPASAMAQPSLDPGIATATRSVTLASGVSTAAVQENVKPTGRAVADGPASDDELSAAARRIADEGPEEGSALGSYYDEASGELVVAVGPESSLTQADVEKLAGVPARLEHRDITKETADTIRERIGGREFSPDAEKYSYASHLNLQTGKVELTTDAPASVIEPLTKEFPDAIELHEDTVRELFHRGDDIAPFWGGSSITSGGGTCTAGFVVRKPSGQRLLTTASHCFPVGATVRTPFSRLVGNVTEQGSLRSFWFWDNRDLELIGGQSYSPRIYVGGTTSSSSKAVVGASDPVPGVSSYCSSGQTSGEQCGITVQSTEAIACVRASGCFWPVIAYTGGPGRPGDSGAPVYIPGSPGQVFARGTLFAGDGTTTYAEKWSKISSAFGVSIVT